MDANEPGKLLLWKQGVLCTQGRGFASCREHEDSCTNPHQLRWVLELLEPWFVFKKVTRRMESEGKGARNRTMGCTHMVSGGYSPGCWVVSDCQGITQP